MISSFARFLRQRFLPFGVSLALALSIVPSTGAALVASTGSAGSLTSFHRIRVSPRLTLAAPPTTAQCLQNYGVPCYSPQQMRTGYGLNPILSAGYNGAGQTIVIVDSYGSPTVTSDLHGFDTAYGIPDPPSFQVLTPLGPMPPFDPNNTDMVNWAFETSLDVQWAHAMAPGANLVLLESPVDETEGTQGLPEFLQLEQYALTNHLGNIISQSWGATENTLMDTSGQQVVSQFETFYAQAAQAKMTVLASAGDQGVANVDANGNPYAFPTVIFPASSPWVTAVGGTSLTLSPSTGAYQSEVVWNDGQPANGATGGGVSQIFSEPRYQNALPASDQAILNGYRGIPDVAYNADVNTFIWIYVGFQNPYAQPPVWFGIGGTSEGSPQWAGMIADANQLAGHPLGFLNPSLYNLALHGNYAGSYHDITQGNNGQNNLPGYGASSGWDPTTGWGSPKAAALIQRLAALP